MCSLHGLLGAVVEQVTTIPVQKVSFQESRDQRTSLVVAVTVESPR